MGQETKTSGRPGGPRKLQRLIIATGVLLGAALIIGAVPAFGIGSRASARRPAVIATAARVPAGARALGPEPSSATQTGAVVLRPRDNAALTRFISAVSTPHSPEFHQYLRRGAFASRFGPTGASIAAVRSQLRTEGLTVTGVSADGLMVRFRGSTSRVQAAFGTRLERYRLADGTIGQGTTSAVHIPASLSHTVAAVLGLNTLLRAHTQLILPPVSARHGFAAATSPAFAHPAGSPTPCSAASSVAQSFGGLTDDAIAHSYGAFGLYGAGDTGSGVHIGIFEQEPFLASDIQGFDQCYFGSSAASQMAARLHVIPVDGGEPAGPGSGEAILDVEDVSAMAPGATIDVYETPNNSLDSLDEYAQMIDSDTDQIISTSWGYCEQDEQLVSPGQQQAENFLFEQAAAQGQTVISAAGDTGDDTCNEVRTVPPPTDQNPLSVGDPASQPYVLGVGGTTIQDATQPAQETVWNDGAQWGGGGGGISQSWTVPSWQLNSRVPGVAMPGSADYTNANQVESENGWPTGFCQGTVTGATSSTPCRLVPDVSADADEFTGAITIYSSSFGGNGWTTIGGTSSAAPIWAGMLALTDASAACSSHGESGIGFASPLLYAVASNPSQYAESFNDITSGNNDVFGFDNGLVFPATTGYDMASGLGSPLLTGSGGSVGLAANLCDMAAAASRPEVTGLSPAFGSVKGGYNVEVNGSNFESGGVPNVAGVQVGTFSVPASDITVSSNNLLEVTMPAAADAIAPPPTGSASPQDGSGPAYVTVQLKDGESSPMSAPSRFDYVDETGSNPVPSVTAISPYLGAESAPSQVKIYGDGFTGASGVTFGGVPAASFTVVSNFEIKATPAAYSSGTTCSGGLPAGETATNDICQAQVEVTNTHGSSATSTIEPPYEGPALQTDQDGLPIVPTGCGCEISPQPTEYDYVPPAHITSVSTSTPANYASEYGGTTITIYGSGFDPLATNYYDFGDPGQTSSMVGFPSYQTGTEVQIDAPPTPDVNAGGSPSTDTEQLPVSVNTNLGQSNGFDVTYAGVPVVSSVATDAGTTTAPDTGGTPITITGQGLDQATAPLTFVDFFAPDGVPFSIGTQYTFTVNSDDSISTETVQQNPAIVDTQVCSVTACSDTSPADELMLYPPGNPKVDSISPTSGPSTGGTDVTINGENLGCVTGVYFGSVAAELYSNSLALLDCGSTTQVDVQAPPGTAGRTVPVTVTTVESDATGSGRSVSSATFTYTVPPPQPRAAASPSTLSLGKARIAGGSAAKTLEITNKGAGRLKVQDAIITGEDPDFAVSSDACAGASLAPKANCKLTVRFRPTALGKRSGTLEIASNDPASPLQVRLSGTGEPTATSSKTARLGNQSISLKVQAPGQCRPDSNKLAVRLESVAERTGTKLTFKRANISIGHGVRHTRYVRIGGKKVLVSWYTPNATTHHVPASRALSLKRRKTGTYSLTAKLFYDNHAGKSLSEALTVPFSIC